MWELACLRKRWFGWHFWRLTRRHRGQAGSHRGWLVCLFFEPAAIQMWELSSFSEAAKAAALLA